MIQYTIVLGVLGVMGVFPSSMVMAVATGDIEIWDGESIEIKQAPHQIALLVNGRFHCGGSLIAPDVVLTAAHCFGLEVVDITPEFKMSIRAGSNRNKKGGVVVKVIGGQMHPQYVLNRKAKDYDIAILRLEKPLSFNEEISAIKLAPKDYKIKDGDMMSVTGWGNMRNYTAPEILQMVELPKFNFAECQKIYEAAISEGFHPVTDRFLCAGTLEGGKNTCHGDSGGPLVHKGVQVGVVSGGHQKCAIPGYPANYQKVSVVREWIDAFINQKTKY